MVAKRRSFTREFKVETVQMLTTTDVSVPEAAADLGLHPNTLYRWVHQYGERPEEAFPGKGHMKPEDAEFHQLRRRVAELEEEREVLKKALAIFSKHPK